MLKAIARRLLGVAGTVSHGTRVAAESFGLRARDELRVLIFHDVPAAERQTLHERLSWLQRSWRFASPAEFEEMMRGRLPVTGRNLLLTFDDGFSSNRIVADEVLNPLGIHALFFVIPEFVDIEQPADARQYIARRIQPGARVEQMDAGLTNMRWEDLDALVAAGHAIGAHTTSHARVSALQGSKERIREIVACGDTIEARLGQPVRHFAFPFGNTESIDGESVVFASKRYEFLHFGVRGSNVGASPLAIRRDGLSMSESPGVVRAFLSGLADPLYASARCTVDEWSAAAFPGATC